MNRTIRRSVLVVIAFAGAASAQGGPEAMSVAAARGFEQAVFTPRTRGFRPTSTADFTRLDPATARDWEQLVSDVASSPDVVTVESATPDPIGTVEFARLFNRHLKTPLRFTLNGRQVWFSGAFDAKQNPYVSIWVDGAAVRYFNVKSLLGEEQHLAFGGASYTLSLSANIFHKLKSTIALTNDANSRDAARFSVQDMLDAIAAAGHPVKLSDQSYRLYYTEGLEGDHGSATTRMIIFIYGDMSDYHVYLIPEESVPSDRVAVFRLFNGKRVGLDRRDGKLEIYENP
jgi:hypothetical protein